MYLQEQDFSFTHINHFCTSSVTTQVQLMKNTKDNGLAMTSLRHRPNKSYTTKVAYVIVDLTKERASSRSFVIYDKGIFWDL